jgi:MFS family permease
MTTIPASSSKRSIMFLLGMPILMLGANFVWVSYNSVLLPTLVENTTTSYRGPTVGLLGFLGTLVGIVVSLLTGIISDRTASRWGKRTPSILVGSLIGIPFIALAAIIYPPALPVIAISFIGMQFFTNIGNGAWWPLLVDTVPEQQRGLASGFQGLYTLLGAALGIGLVTWLNQIGETALALWIIGIVFAATGVINSLVIRGYDKPAERAQPINLWNVTREMFHVRTRVVVFFWVVVSALLANMGLNSLQFFARFFFETYFPSISPDAGFRIMGTISLLFTMLAAIGSGLLSDKIGRRKLILGAMFVSAVATLGMGLTSNFYLFLIIAAIRSAATGPIIAVVPALASDLAPEDEAGQYMAYNNLSTGVSGALASLIFGFILTSMTKTGFILLFVISALLFLAGGLVFQFKVTQKELEKRIKHTG